jgi:Domain of unknown function (DUF6134)
MGRWVLSAAVLLAAGFAVPAFAAPERYAYRVIHPTYGDIGTYTNIIERNGDTTEVKSELHIAVRLLGIVFFRQDAERTELWRGQKLVRFDGVTTTDGKRLPVHGEARDGGFVITTPTGTVTAPASVHPSNPWSPMVLDTRYMMSTRTGQVLPVHVSGGEVEPVALSGVTLRLHQYEVVSDKHQFVWLDDRGTPVAFRTNEHGKPVDFVLQGRQQLADSNR